MDIEEQLISEILELKQLIERGQHNKEPRHLLKMYESLIKTKEQKLKLTIRYG